MAKSGIYAIVSPSGKMYIGSSQDIPKRWEQHRNALRGGYHHNRMVQRAYNKYGMDALRFTVLEHCSVDDLLIREQFHIDARTWEFLYNLSPQAGGTRGYKSSEATKAKLRAALGGRTLSAEHRANLRIAHQGLRHSAESRAKVSAARKGKPLSAEHRANLSAATNTSGFRGVALDRRNGRFVAYARINGTRKHIGKFDTPEHANAYRLYWLATQGVL